jgi:DNA repair exonuclease SbcCD ATPase subunit
MDIILKNKIRNIEDQVLIKKNNFQEKKKQIEQINQKVKEIIEEIELDVKSIEFIEKIAEENRNNVKDRIESLINKALKQVYGETYSIEFQYGISNNKTAVEVKIVKKLNNGLEVKRDVTEGNGLGVADLVSLPLKIMVLLSNDDIAPILIADEPGKHMDEGRAELFAKFLKAISKELNMQLIVCSHWEVMKEYADNCVNVNFDGQKSQVHNISL